MLCYAIVVPIAMVVVLRPAVRLSGGQLAPIVGGPLPHNPVENREMTSNFQFHPKLSIGLNSIVGGTHRLLGSWS